MTVQNVPSKGRISIIKFQNYTIQKRKSVIRVIYGILFFLLGIILIAIRPVDIVTNLVLNLREGSFIFRMWENPPYEVYNEVYVFNYTNVEEYLSGKDKVLKVTEVGPFRYQEFRRNENMTIDSERGTMSMKPNVTLKMAREGSLADPKDVNIMIPNIPLIAISTLAADQLGYFANVGAYYSITALGSKLFVNKTVQEYMWGYHDPIVTIASKLLPGWIDFGKIGIMDRFYAHKADNVEVELKDPKKRFSIKMWDNSPGLREQGFTDLNTSTLCNRLQGSYEGIMVAPNLSKDQIIPIFRKQACGVYPFVYQKEIVTDYGVKYYRFTLQDSAFNRTSAYACECKRNCLPEGFVDISSCYYGFPIVLSKPHFMDVDPVQSSYFEGMNPDPEKHGSKFDIEPNVGVPLALTSRMQVNLAVRTSSGNPITKPLNNKIMPLLWISLFCTQPPPMVVTLLRLRFVIAPPLILIIEILLLVVGIVLGVQGAYRLRRPKYKLIQVKENLKPKNKIVENFADNKVFNDDELEKQAVALLGIKNEDLPTLIFPDT